VLHGKPATGTFESKTSEMAANDGPRLEEYARISAVALRLVQVGQGAIWRRQAFRNEISLTLRLATTKGDEG
jgi:hypothetical protein